MDQAILPQSLKEIDGYHRWLGIPKSEQPPNHYRLLGITLFEADLDVIDTAAGARMAMLRQQQSGPHSDLCTRILNQVSQARLCLLKGDTKTTYDEKLSVELRRVSTSISERDDVESTVEIHLVDSANPRSRSSRRSSHPAAHVVGAVLGGLTVWLMLWKLDLMPSSLSRNRDRGTQVNFKAAGNQGTRIALTGNGSDADPTKPRNRSAVDQNRDRPGVTAENPFGIEGLLTRTDGGIAASGKIPGFEKGVNPKDEDVQSAFPSSEIERPANSFWGNRDSKAESPEASKHEHDNAEIGVGENQTIDVAKADEQALARLADAKRIFAAEQAKSKADLLQQFDKQVASILKGDFRPTAKQGPEGRSLVVKTLQAERRAFVDFGRPPLSWPMRAKSVEYAQSVRKCQVKLEGAFQRAQMHFLNSRNVKIQTELVKERQRLIQPTLVFTWRYTAVPGRTSVLKFYSNGIINTGRNTWELSKNQIICRGRDWIDTLDLSLDGRSMKGTNDKGHPKSAIIVDPK